MPIDTSQPLREIRNQMGGVYREQSGVIYDALGNVVSQASIPGYSYMPPNLKPLVRQTLLACSVSFVLAGGTAGGGSNQFTMGNNGAISTMTADAQATVRSFGAWLYLPANAIQAGSTAGWYWFVASSSTAGTVYNNQYVSGDPKASIPATPTPFVSTGPGLVTQTSAAGIDGPNIVLPGGSLGPNGALFSDALGLCNNNANAKTSSVYLGTVVTSSSHASVTGRRMQWRLMNMNDATKQRATNGWNPQNDGSLATYPANFSTCDTGANQVVKYTMNIAQPQDIMTCEFFGVDFQFGA